MNGLAVPANGVDHVLETAQHLLLGIEKRGGTVPLEKFAERRSGVEGVAMDFHQLSRLGADLASKADHRSVVIDNVITHVGMSFIHSVSLLFTAYLC